MVLGETRQGECVKENGTTKKQGDIENGKIIRLEVRRLKFYMSLEVERESKKM